MINHLIIPHRNRLDCLVNQSNHLNNFIKENNLIDEITINYVEFIDNKPFNLGISINAGYKILDELKELNSEDNFWFIPIDILLLNKFSFLIPENTFISIAPVRIDDAHEHYKLYGIKVKDFKKINGHSNKFYGWGAEDSHFKQKINSFGIEIQHIRHHEKLEDNLFIDCLTNQKNGQSDFSNSDLNAKLINETSDGLTDIDIHLFDRFELIKNMPIFYNMFKLKE